jgi:hypothetical protein
MVDIATTSVKPKTATERLAEKMGDLVPKAAERMNDQQFNEAEKRSAKISARVRARVSRRDTA